MGINSPSFKKHTHFGHVNPSHIHLQLISHRTTLNAKDAISADSDASASVSRALRATQHVCCSVLLQPMLRGCTEEVRLNDVSHKWQVKVLKAMIPEIKGYKREIRYKSSNVGVLFDFAGGIVDWMTGILSYLRLESSEELGSYQLWSWITKMYDSLKWCGSTSVSLAANVWWRYAEICCNNCHCPVVSKLI